MQMLDGNIKQFEIGFKAANSDDSSNILPNNVDPCISLISLILHWGYRRVEGVRDQDIY